jgi:hypothetical protein
MGRLTVDGRSEGLGAEYCISRPMKSWPLSLAEYRDFAPGSRDGAKPVLPYWLRQVRSLERLTNASIDMLSAPEEILRIRTRVSHPICHLHPTKLEGFDSLAELALDMY